MLGHINAMVDLTEEELRKVARSKKNPWSQRTAAERMLRTMEASDIADFAGLLRGENNIEDLRAMGINTEVVKKFKQKTRIIPTGEGKETEEVIDREIEFHDRAGEDFDRLLDRTNGRPTQAVEVSGPDKGPIQTQKKRVDYDAIKAEFASIGIVVGGVQPDSH